MPNDIPNWAALPLSLIFGAGVSIFLIIKQQNIVDFYNKKSESSFKRTLENELKQFNYVKRCKDDIRELVSYEFHINIRIMMYIMIVILSTILLIGGKMLLPNNDIVFGYNVPARFIFTAMMAGNVIISLSLTFYQYRLNKIFLYRATEFDSYVTEMKEKWKDDRFH
jgi:hypothetical protein